MSKVTKQSLAERVKYLESVRKLGLSLSEEYQLEAYRMLIDLLGEKTTGCVHDYKHVGNGVCQCARCGRRT